MQRRPEFAVFQHLPEPNGLIRGLEKRMIAVNGRVLSLNDILDLTDSFGGDIADSLDVLRNEQQMMRVDVSVVDEAPGLLWTAAGVVLVHQTTLVVHETVQI